MVAEDGTIYIGSTDGTFYGVTSDGALLSSFRTGNRIDSSPALGADGPTLREAASGILACSFGSAGSRAARLVRRAPGSVNARSIG